MAPRSSGTAQSALDDGARGELGRHPWPAGTAGRWLAREAAKVVGCTLSSRVSCVNRPKHRLPACVRCRGTASRHAGPGGLQMSFQGRLAACTNSEWLAHNACNLPAWKLAFVTDGFRFKAIVDRMDPPLTTIASSRLPATAYRAATFFAPQSPGNANTARPVARRQPSHPNTQDAPITSSITAAATRPASGHPSTAIAIHRDRP